MGLNADWLIAVESLLAAENIQVENLNHTCFHLLFIPQGKLILNLVPLSHPYQPEKFIELQQAYQLKDIHVIHLWEDIFITRQAQVLSRIKSFAGLNRSVHGRNTFVERISKEDADVFLNQYHLQGSVGARYRFCLIHENETVAVATFSNKRKMVRQGPDYTSAELIRFATKDGITVTGGLSKLIKHYVKLLAPNDLMSYADRDWSLGNGYLVAGFKLKAITPPSKLYLDRITLQRYFSHRIPDKTDQSAASSYIEIFNTGNLKFILDL
ncbi:hypothetical protein [Pedobacter immunditicola]|uniref:hypothetical protein n=1 Tax=Pedobacter immunditicola TaxID=3133440 RepID=UPI0030A2818A